MRIILGSASKNRKLVLERQGYEFEVVTADIDEKAIRTKDFYQLPLLIAREKSKAIISKLSEPAILITADQVVIWNGELREKPKDLAEARRFLETYSGSKFPATACNGVVVANTKTGKIVEGRDVSKMYFKSIPPEVVDAIIADQKVLNWAGGFTPEYELIKPYILRIEGTNESLMGLPIPMISELINLVSSER